jgi:DNA polymerase III sliding clamp (beta) subunit (PCNA family)
MKEARKRLERGSFSVKAGELKDALGPFEHVVPKDADDETLGHILLYQRGIAVELVYSNHEVSARFDLPICPLPGVFSLVRVAVPYKQLVDFVENIPSDAEIVFTPVRDEDHVPYLLVDSPYDNATFRGMAADKYPPYHAPSTGFYIDIDVDIFREMVSSTVFAAADEPYNNLHSVCFNFLSDRTDCVATNNFILSLYSRTDAIFVSTREKTIIIPVKALQAFVRGIEGVPSGQKVDMRISEDRVRLKCGFFSLSSVLIEDPCPPYQKVIPTETPHVAVFRRKRLRDAIRKLLLPESEDMARVNFKFEGDGVMISNPDRKSNAICMEGVLCRSGGRNLEIRFDAKRLLLILENIKSDRIVMRMTDLNRPVIIEPENQTPPVNRLCLIMPLAVRD